MVNAQTLINQTRAQFRPVSTNQARIASNTAAASNAAPPVSASVAACSSETFTSTFSARLLKESADTATTTASTR